MDARPADPDTALAPIEIDVVVPCDARRAFDYFTRDIARWWPLRTHSCAKEHAASVAFEPGEGGGLVETARDGTTHRWGTVKTWEPGRRVAFTWHPSRDPSTAQLVEVVFRDHPSGARVTLTHGGWEALGERAAAMRDAYRGGWAIVLGRAFRDYGVTATSRT
jgi:uncharacterized protein YndB with AHSA1/START domain